MKQTLEPQAVERAVEQLRRRGRELRQRGETVSALGVVTSLERAKNRGEHRLRQIAQKYESSNADNGPPVVFFACCPFNPQTHVQSIVEEREQNAARAQREREARKAMESSSKVAQKQANLKLAEERAKNKKFEAGGRGSLRTQIQHLHMSVGNYSWKCFAISN